MESWFLNTAQTLSLCSGSTDSKTLDYQRTNPREYQIVRTHTKETTWIQDQASPNPHLKNKTKIQTQSSADSITTSLSLAHQRKKKLAHRNSALISPYKKLIQTTGLTLEGRNQKEERIQLWSLGKGDLKHNKLKKKNEKAEKYCTNELTN